MAKNDIRTDHEEIGYLLFILRNIFHCIFIEQLCIFSKVVKLIIKDSKLSKEIF